MSQQKAAHKVSLASAFPVLPSQCTDSYYRCSSTDSEMGLKKCSGLSVPHITPNQALSNTFIYFANETSKLQCLLQKSVSGHRYVKGEDNSKTPQVSRIRNQSSLMQLISIQYLDIRNGHHKIIGQTALLNSLSQWNRLQNLVRYLK